MKTKFENTWILGRVILNNWDTFIFCFWNEVQNQLELQSHRILWTCCNLNRLFWAKYSPSLISQVQPVCPLDWLVMSWLSMIHLALFLFLVIKAVWFYSHVTISDGVVSATLFPFTCLQQCAALGSPWILSWRSWLTKYQCR